MSKKVLNEAVPVQQDGSSWEPVQLAVQLQKDMLKLKGEYMSDDGRSVDYVRLKNSDTFKDYIKQTCQLHYLDLTKLSLTERKAFFISILYLGIRASLCVGACSIPYRKSKYFGAKVIADNPQNCKISEKFPPQNI